MARADANQVAIRWARESTWGETPATPATTEARVTSENLQHGKETVISQEIRADRQRPDALRVAVNAQGDFQFELSYGNFEQFFESALKGTIASAIVENTALSFAASSITASAGATTIWNNYKVGQWVRVHGASTTANNGVRKVAAISGATLHLTGATGAVEGTTTAAAVNGRRLRNGTVETSYYLEVDFTDIAGVKYFTGMEVDQMSLDLQSDQILVGSFSFMGSRGFTASATVASSVVTSAQNTDVMTAASHVGDVRENGVATSTQIQSLQIQLTNNLRHQRAIGSIGAIGIGAGGVDVTGTATFYFESIAMYKKLMDHTSTSLSFRVTDPDDNVIVLTLPKIYFSQGDPVAGGIDQDVFLPLQFMAVRDPVTDNTIQMDFLPASV